MSLKGEIIDADFEQAARYYNARMFGSGYEEELRRLKERYDAEEPDLDALVLLFAEQREKFAGPHHPDVKRVILPEDVEWEIDRSERDKDGNILFPDKPEKEMIFEESGALALMLRNEVIFLNCHWWEKDWPEEARNRTSLSVNCNDTFAWACSDAVTIDYVDIEPVYRHWIKDPIHGAEVWCCIKRRQMPQHRVEMRIRDAGVWDLDALKVKHNLRENYQAGASKVDDEVRDELLNNIDPEYTAIPLDDSIARHKRWVAWSKEGNNATLHRELFDSKMKTWRAENGYDN